MYSDDTWLCPDRENPWVLSEEILTRVNANRRNLGEICDQYSVIHKVLCVSTPHNLKQLQTMLRKCFSQLTMVQSAPNYLEITKYGVEKGKAIKILCKHLKIPLEKAIAFGDNYNDLDMLKVAGIGYVMENAPEEIKNKIRNVTKTNNDDGVAYILKKEFKI